MVDITVTPETWIVSDTHFGHKNIVKYCNRPQGHELYMHRNWNSVIGIDDQVLHLGDLAVWYGPEEEYWLEYARSLHGRKFLIKGNHDLRKEKVYAKYDFTMIPEFVQEFEGQRVLFSHYPDVDRIGDWDINIHGHIHNNPLDPVLAKTKRRYVNVSMEVMDYKPARLADILGL